MSHTGEGWSESAMTVPLQEEKGQTQRGRTACEDGDRDRMLCEPRTASGQDALLARTLVGPF